MSLVSDTNWQDYLIQHDDRWQNGATYDGEFAHGLYNGLGTFVWEDLGVYKGTWKDGVRSGVGTYSSGDKLYVYDGEWSEDAKDGRGFQKLPNGRSFEGTFVKGLPASGVLHISGYAPHLRFRLAPTDPPCGRPVTHVSAQR